MMLIQSHRHSPAGKGLTPAQDPTLAPLPSYAAARPLLAFPPSRTLWRGLGAGEGPGLGQAAGCPDAGKRGPPAPEEHGHPVAEGPAQHPGQDQVAGKGKRGSRLGKPVGTGELLPGYHISASPCPSRAVPVPRSPRSPRRGAASPGVARGRPGSFPALDPTPGVFQRFIFSTVCNSRPLAPAAEPGGVPHPTGRGGWQDSGRCCRQPSPGLLPVPLAAPGPGSLTGMGALPGSAAPAYRGRVKPHLARPGRKGGTRGAADGKFSNPGASPGCDETVA